MARSVYSEITPEMEALANLCVKNGKIDRSFAKNTT